MNWLKRNPIAIAIKRGGDAVSSLIEAVETLLGQRGDPLDRVLTLRDLYEAGMIELKSTLGQVRRWGGTPHSLIVNPGDAPLLAPEFLTVTSGFAMLMLEFDVPTTQRYAYTKIYRADTDLFPDEAGFLATSAAGIYVDDVGAGGITKYYWIRHVGTNAEQTALNSTNGTAGTTAVDPGWMLDLLEGQLSESQLVTDLNARIDLIDGPDDTPGTIPYQLAQEIAARETAITNEATIRQNAVDALAQSISLVTAGLEGSFDPGVIWYFDVTTESWSAAGGTATWNSGWVDVTSSGVDPQFISPSGMTVSGSVYQVIKARIKRLAGTGWDGTAFYQTSGHGFSASYCKTISMPAGFDTVGDTVVVEFDMSDLTAGGTDWASNTITQIRLDFGSTPDDVISVDWVGIGRNAPGASMAGLMTEQTARIAADQAISDYSQALYSQVNNATTGLPATRATLLSDYSTKAYTDSAVATASSTLSARLNTGGDVSNAIVAAQNTATAANTLASAAATASSVETLSTTVGGHTTTLQTQATSIGGLQAKYTVKIDNNGHVTGYGLASTENNGTPVGEFAIVADRFSISPPISGSTDPDASDGSPFFFLATPQTINGVSVPAGTYMKGAFIHDATITTAKIKDAAVDNAKIASVSAAKITAGSIAVGNYIQSSNYLSGATGWKIHGDGSLEMNSGTFRGALSAATGTFAGSLSAATGTFAGELSAATGSFSGTVTVGAGSSVDYSYVTGATRPADNATVGAPAGTYVGATLAETVASNAASGATAWGKFSGAGNTLPSGNVEFNFAGSASKGGNATNTDAVGTQSAATVQIATINFNARNDRTVTAITTPTIASDGTAVDHTISTDGAANISLEWSWAGTNTDIDGWIIYVRQSTSATAYTFGTTPAEEQVFYVTPEKRAFFLYGAAANQYYTFGVQAYRIVDPDINAAGVIKSTLVKPSASAENPYRPSATVAFAGDITGTVDGTAASTVVANAANGASAWSKFSGSGNTLPSGNVEFLYALGDTKGGNAVNTNSVGSQSATTVQNATINFNGRNDRNATAVTVPAVANTSGTIDHVSNTDGSVDVSFEWTWGGTESDIDGFIVYVHDNGTTTPSSRHVFSGSADASEQVFYLTPQRRAFILYGVAADHWYTLGVQAYRVVDPDVNAAGVLKSTIAQPLQSATETTQGAYRPSSNVAFLGLIGSTLAQTVESNASTALANAATAQTAANTANTALTNIASDNILSPSEKPAIKLEYDVLIAEQAGIDAQATSYSITTEKTAYDTAISELTTYLGTLSGWNTIPGTDVVIVGTTFRTKFQTVYTARQALLNKIAANAKVLADAAQSTASSKVTTFFTTSTPTALATGDLWYNDTTKLLKRWDGAAWVTVSNAFSDLNQMVNTPGYDNTNSALTTGTTITGGGITLSGGGAIKTAGKDSASDTTAGFFLGWDTSAYQFAIGNATQNMKWNGSTLSLNGGSFDVSTTGNVRGGQTDYNTGTGFFLGYSGGAHKFSIGNPAGNYLAWDGSSLTINGKINGQLIQSFNDYDFDQLLCPNGTWTDLQSRTITTTDGSTVTFNLLVYQTSGTTKFRFKRDSTVLFTIPKGGDGTLHFTGDHWIFLSWTDSPSSGSHTYSWQCQHNVPGNATVYERQMKLEEWR